MSSSVPRISIRKADDLGERIEALKSEAAARGFGTLVFFLDTALIEARLQEQHIIDDTAMALAKPADSERRDEERD